jgi:3-hydroxyacyl-CoA dehydrogenase
MRQNRMLKGPEAFDLGFADRLLDPVEFVDESIAFARELAENGHDRGQTPDMSEIGDVIRKARARLDESLHGAAPAPYRALELIEGAATWTLEEGYRAEEEALGDLLPGPEAQASIYAFDLVEFRAKKLALAGEPRRVEKVGVVGAGLMATQIATLLLERLRVPLVIRDLDAATVERALASIREDVDPFLGSIVSGTTGHDGFDGCDLVLEAVYEEIGVKKQVFADLREAAPGAILATNTSSLSVAEMGADVGIHFFNPVALMPLVELVRHDGTDESALATAATIVQKLRKRPVVVEDAPGFVVNRILTRMTRVLMDALEHGNTVDETDEAILRLGLPMAPSVLLQMVGPRVANQVLETMHETYPDRFTLSPGLAALAEGRDVEVLEQRPRSIDEITEAALEAMADEIRHVLDEGVVAEAADVDTCLLLGAGFPFWLGGITPHLEARGLFERREIGYSPA